MTSVAAAVAIARPRAAGTVAPHEDRKKQRKADADRDCGRIAAQEVNKAKDRFHTAFMIEV